MVSRPASLVFALALVPLACTEKDDTPEASDADTNAESTTDATATDSEAGTGVDTEETTGEPAEPVPAHGIHVDWIEANQGIGVKIGENGEWVGPEGRSAFLLQNRIALVRAFWRMDDDFEFREIRAELTLEFPDGTTEVLVDEKMVDDDSFIGNLSKSFYWGIMAEQAVPGLKYRVDLYEVASGYDDAPNPTPGLPSDGGTVLVGVEDSNQVLDIVLVPFDYDNGSGCSGLPDMSDETMQLFYEYMYMMNPVDTVNITIHDAEPWPQELNNFSELNAYMSDLRFEENAPPGTYYYGYIDTCSGGVGGAGGQAYGIPDIPPTMEQAYQRVSSGLWASREWSADTFVHEVGHSQGRRHVFCNGDEGGPDITYPIEGGDIGEWGFGIIDFQLRHPTMYKDYMTYCHPAWVSTWGWNKIYPVIRDISMWSAADATVPSNSYGGAVLVGTINADGSEIWHTVPGAVRPERITDQTQVEFSVAGEVVAVHGTQVTELQDAAGHMIVAPLPTGFDAVDGIALRRGGTARPLDKSTMRLRHHFVAAQ